MAMREKLNQVTERRERVEQELDALRHARAGSSNAALADLETALMSELGVIESQIQQLNAYLDSVEVAGVEG